MYHAPYINYVVRWKLLSDHPVLEMSFVRKKTDYMLSILINLINYSEYHVFHLIIFFKQLTVILYTQCSSHLSVLYCFS